MLWLALFSLSFHRRRTDMWPRLRIAVGARRGRRRGALAAALVSLAGIEVKQNIRQEMDRSSMPRLRYNRAPAAEMSRACATEASEKLVRKEAAIRSATGPQVN